MVKICLLFPEDGVCNADGGHSVFCIEVSADAAGIVFIEDGAADKDKDARRLFPQETDGFLHAPHSGCHQGGEADQADILLQGAGKNFLRGHVLAKIKNPVHSRAYIRHLLKAGEMLGLRLCVMHNLYFYNTLMEDIRLAIEEQRYEAFREDFIRDYSNPE